MIGTTFMHSMDFNVTETCQVMDTYVTVLFIPLCLFALLGIVTYLAYRIIQKSFTNQNVERVHIYHDTNTAHTEFYERIDASVEDITAELKPMSQTKFNERIYASVKDITAELKPLIHQSTETVSLSSIIADDNLSCCFKETTINTRQTIEDTEKALQENQQDSSSSEIVSAIKTHAFLSSEMKSSEANLASHIEQSEIITRRTIEDTVMALKDNQQDCTTEIVSHIGQQTSFLSSELKSSENNLSSLIEKSAIDTRRTLEDTEMALTENQQDCTTEIVSQIGKHTLFLSSELKSSENNLSSLIDKSAIDTRRTIEDTEMALKENQQDCSTEIVTQIRTITSSLSSELNSSENNLSSHIQKLEIDSRSRHEALDRKLDHLIAVNRTPPGQDDCDAKCHVSTPDSENFLDLVAGIQGSRMNEQRASLPQFHGLNSQAVINQYLRERNVNDVPDDSFFEMLMCCQGSRIDDQRSALPHNRPVPTVPDEDFLGLIQKVQSSRLEEQRTNLPDKDETLPPQQASVKKKKK